MLYSSFSKNKQLLESIITKYHLCNFKMICKKLKKTLITQDQERLTGIEEQAEHSRELLYRGYYTVARRYEFYVRLATRT